ncbi:peptide-methionine (S)-S-oxide reductase MsrA [Desulfurobacterium atlanticum]|uniref:Peptide methionine sulfoxide reductase MsrA n=1 Tax=Desulfurobacterium atlanticum TaxID=240169 RepID=A0A238Z4E9_9BACT|nr:peptide-methionine (S)-S-oxide reductase MsrA [Desulfurobacterium atlanticum]SNR77838.1 peptide-methionine (S)-S-oxide reductase [Desulfurobacterium atlanticum]
MIKEATFAGGCFWCLEETFSKLEGVIEVIPGYAGGTVKNPSYEEVLTGETGHVEAVKVKYDSTKISYRELLIAFWCCIDPTDKNGQFADRGPQYQTVIFYHNEEQKKLAEKSKKILEESKLFTEPIATQIKPFENFYEAEDYHRNFFKKEPFRYEKYKELSGRAGYCKIVWKKKNGRKILEENL